MEEEKEEGKRKIEESETELEFLKNLWGLGTE
jgi:hypothetical protein